MEYFRTMAWMTFLVILYVHHQDESPWWVLLVLSVVLLLHLFALLGESSRERRETQITYQGGPE